MKESKILFSRLLKIFTIDDQTAFIIELDENGKKELYISYKPEEGLFCFKRKDELKEDKYKGCFNNLSDHCLMSECTDTHGMFAATRKIKEFKADCSSVVNARCMFMNSGINKVEANFDALEDGSFMFCESSLEEINTDFPNLKNGRFMFYGTKMKKFDNCLKSLEDAESMFMLSTDLKDFKTKKGMPMLKNAKDMFLFTNKELKRNIPSFFV